MFRGTRERGKGSEEFRRHQVTLRFRASRCQGSKFFRQMFMTSLKRVEGRMAGLGVVSKL